MIRRIKNIIHIKTIRNDTIILLIEYINDKEDKNNIHIKTIRNDTIILLF